jgi:hypothetical protein
MQRLYRRAGKQSLIISTQIYLANDVVCSTHSQCYVKTTCDHAIESFDHNPSIMAIPIVLAHCSLQQAGALLHHKARRAMILHDASASFKSREQCSIAVLAWMCVSTPANCTPVHVHPCNFWTNMPQKVLCTLHAACIQTGFYITAM